ncbi:hypothetical protein C8R47DRAFT_1070218 [Mycena vitilis]|nr:hypothetical protein C8R47DRAFT_1070218 [Mycena vitilis]
MARKNGERILADVLLNNEQHRVSIHEGESEHLVAKLAEPFSVLRNGDGSAIEIGVDAYPFCKFLTPVQGNLRAFELIDQVGVNMLVGAHPSTIKYFGVMRKKFASLTKKSQSLVVFSKEEPDSVTYDKDSSRVSFSSGEIGRSGGGDSESESSRRPAGGGGEGRVERQSSDAASIRAPESGSWEMGAWSATRGDKTPSEEGVDEELLVSGEVCAEK